MKHTDAIYDFPGQLFRAHDATTPREYAREAYDRTECGVWTSIITARGYLSTAEMNDYENTVEWATRHAVGIQHGTIVEGSDAEFTAAPLFFPFSDKELAEVWQTCEDFLR